MRVSHHHEARARDMSKPRSKTAAVVKELVPPIVLDAVRKARGHHYKWQGVYRSFDEVPVRGRGYSDPRYIAAIRDHLNDSRTQAQGFPHISGAVLNEEALLPFFVAAIAPQQPGPMSILDFGGGLGHCYEMLRQSLTSTIDVDYHVVDLKSSADEGPAVFPGDRSIHFHEAIPTTLQNLDIVYMRGVLSYVADYVAVIKALCATRPKWILILNLPAGKFQTFVSAQIHYFGSTVAHWFFNLEEILELMKRERYSLVFRGPHEDRYDLSNLPQGFRLENDHASNLLFARHDRL